MARGLFEDDKTRIAWNLPPALSPKNRVKLLLNLLILAGQTIPRGGTLTVDAIGDGEIQGFRVTAAGLNARIPQAIPGLVSGEAGLAAIERTRSSRFTPACLPAAAACRWRWCRTGIGS